MGINMKKIILLALPIILVGLFLCGYVINNLDNRNKNGTDNNEMNAYEETLQAAEELNKNSNLGVTLLQACNERGTFNPQAPVGGLLGKEKVDGSFYYFPYPYDKSQKITESDCILNQLYLYSSKYNVFGIKVGDMKDSVVEIMKTYGYTENAEKDPYYEAQGIKSLLYENYDIHIRFFLRDDIAGTIDEIFIWIG